MEELKQAVDSLKVSANTIHHTDKKKKTKTRLTTESECKNRSTTNKDSIPSFSDDSSSHSAR